MPSAARMPPCVDRIRNSLPAERRRIPPHARVLRPAEQIARRPLAQHVGGEWQRPGRPCCMGTNIGQGGVVEVEEIFHDTGMVARYLREIRRDVLRLFRSRERISFRVSLSDPLVRPTPMPASKSNGFPVRSTTQKSWCACSLRGMEILHGAEVCVLLDGQSPPGLEVVRDAGRRCEHKVSETVVGRVEDRVEDDVDRPRCQPTIGRISEVNARRSHRFAL